MKEHSISVRKWQIAVLCGLVLTVLISMTGFEAQCEQIRQSLLRLHIIANSDSDTDQQLKLAVRDRLIEEGALLLDGAVNEEQAAAMAQQVLPQLQAAAQDEVYRRGFDYPVSVSIGKAWFDTRVYEEVTLPAGEYEALRVIIGAGEGKNWWCVMFPPMCLPAAGEQEELSGVLEKGAMDIVQGGTKYEFKFKAVEIYEEIAQKVREWL